MSRACTLYSLFETKENIESLGVRPKLAKQRYLAAWDFSAQLCAIEHPGKAPCFFPSDFSSVPGRRSAQSILTLADNCPSLLFYEEYHKHVEISPQGLSRDQAGDSLRPSSPKQLPQTDEKKSPVTFQTHGTGDTELVEKTSGKPMKENLKVKFMQKSKKANTKEKVRLSATEDNSPEKGACETLDTENRTGDAKQALTFNSSSKGHNKIADPIEEDCLVGAVERAPIPAEGGNAPSHNVDAGAKSTFFKSLDSFKRSIARKCMGRQGDIFLNTSSWANADEAFLERLTREFQEVEQLISNYLETFAVSQLTQ